MIMIDEKIMDALSLTDKYFPKVRKLFRNTINSLTNNLSSRYESCWEAFPLNVRRNNLHKVYMKVYFSVGKIFNSVNILKNIS